ncbi:MAG: HU family DNA-binding protein [Trueperaceae bacterium]|nr:HU family DNA-binding protein [Trueperaceae bacterium]
MARAKAAPKKADKTVSKADLVGEVAEATGQSKKAVKETMDALLASMTSSIAKGSKVTLTGFGTFEVRKRKARTGVKPGTTEKIKIPASQYPAFKAGKSLKDTVSGKKPAAKKAAAKK